MRKQSARLPRNIARLVVLSVAAALLMPVVASAPAILPDAPFTVRADAAGCLDDSGNPVSCDIDLDPTPLPVGQSIGEYELAMAGRASDGSVIVRPQEWQTGGTVGACVPFASGCQLTSKALVGTPLPDEGSEVTMPSQNTPTATQGDLAVVAQDFDGDGRQEQVTATQCASSDELCMSMYNPATNSHTGWQPTGIYVDDTIGRIRLSSGLTLRTTSTITRVTFSANPEGGVLATFTTDEPHRFIPGQPVRFDENQSLAERMCPALAAGSILCGGGTSANWLPVESVPTDDTFTVRIGSLTEESGNSSEDETDAAIAPTIPQPWPDLTTLGSLDGPVSLNDTKIVVNESGPVPPSSFSVVVDNETMKVTDRRALDQTSSTYTYTVTRTAPSEHNQGATVSQACSTCGLGVNGLRPGLAVGYSSPGSGASLATLQVKPNAAEPFAVIDDVLVGSLATTTTSTNGAGSPTAPSLPGRDAFDVETADFDGDGQAEIAVAYAADSGFGTVRFFAVNEAKQLASLSLPARWDSVNGKAPYDISLASGFFSSVQGSNTTGDDLAIAWGGQGHVFEVFDVSTAFRLTNVTIDDSDATQSKGAWKADTTYNPGDIVQDSSGWWQTTTGGVARCTPTAEDAQTFWVAAPNPGQVPASFKDALPTSPWEHTANNPSQDLVGANTPEGANSMMFGILAPQPTAGPRTASVAVDATNAATANEDYLQGLYITPPLQAQTVDNVRLTMFVEAAILSGSSNARAQAVVRLVDANGNVRSTVYGGDNGAPSDAPQYPLFKTTAADPKISYGSSRSFLRSDAGLIANLGDLDINAGDRLQIEFGSRRLSQTTSMGSIIWTGNSGPEKLPTDETRSALDPQTQRVAYSPWAELSTKVKLDNCKTHFGDFGITDWKRVQVPTMIRTWNPGTTGDPAANLAAVTSAGYSTIEIDAGDFDMDGLDEIVIGETTPAGSGQAAPLDIEVWQASYVSDCSSQVSAGAGQSCQSASGPGKAMLFGKAASSKGGPNVAAYGSVASPAAGQLSLAVGRVGRGSDDSITVPNGMNADIVVSWTCTAGTSTCGSNPSPTPTGAGAGVAALDVCIPDSGESTLCSEKKGTWAVNGRSTSFIPGDAVPNSMSEAQHNLVPFALADLNQDSTLLGSPLEYLQTGHVQPMLVLRAPPVHFDAIDQNGDGAIDSTETWDVNNCFADYLLVGNNYVCDTDVSYGSTTTVTSTVAGEVHNSATYAGAVQVDGGGGTGTGDCERDKESGGIAIKGTGGTGYCLEASGYIRVGLNGGQHRDASSTLSRSFTYSATVTTAAGADAIYAAVQQNQVNEYPVYLGTGWGLGAGDPVEYVSTISPVNTRFQWMSSEDFDIPTMRNGTVGQNILSYARTEDQLAVSAKEQTFASAKVTADGSVELAGVGTTDFSCAVDNEVPQTDTIIRTENYRNGDRSTGFDAQADDNGNLLNTYDKIVSAKDLSTTNLVDTYPCAIDNQAVVIRNSNSAYDRTYLVTRKLGENKLRLDPQVPLPPDAGTITSGSLVRTPSRFPADEWTVRRYRELHAELTTNNESGYESSFGWHFGIGVELHAELQAAFGMTGVAFGGVGGSLDFSADYAHEELQTLSVGTTNETSFTVDVSGNVKPNISYTIQPYLVQAPNGAMVLDWTASPNVLDTFWHKYYYEPGPDPAFALPNLLTPYKAPYPNSRKNATVPTLLKSPDFASWQCAREVQITGTVFVSGQDCEPTPSAETNKQLLLTANVHNYSLKAYDSSIPLKIRFYVGDPATGGYMIAEGDIPSVRDRSCVNRFCLPAQGQQTVILPVDWKRLYPGLAGRGRPTAPLPIYAIIDPGNKVTNEVHDLEEPVDIQACRDTYPVTTDSATFRGESLCPTTNNEGWYLQQFDGKLARPTNLRITSKDIIVKPDGSAVTVNVHASKQTGRVEVRYYVCPSDSTCLPQTSKQYGSSLAIAQIPAGGSVTRTMPLTLGPGDYRIAVQVVARDNYEAPGGGPYEDAGMLADNQARVAVTIGRAN